MSEQEILLNNKLQQLFDILSDIIPISNIEDHPFSFYKEVIGNIENTIDLQISNKKKEREFLEEEINKYKEEIKKYSEKLALEKIKIPNISNLNLLKEFLTNELKKIYLIKSKVESEILETLRQIQEATSCLYLTTNNNTTNDLTTTNNNSTSSNNDQIDVSLERLSSLRLKLSELSKEKEIKEMKRQSFYNSIETFCSILKRETNFSYDEKICLLEKKAEDLKEEISYRKEKMAKIIEEIKKGEEYLQIEGKVISDDLDDGNFTFLREYLEFLEKEQTNRFDQIFDHINS